MRYKATFKENFVLYSLFGSVAIFGLYVGLKTQDAALIGISLPALLFFLLIRIRLYVDCTAESLEIRSLFKTRKIRWDQITEVKSLWQTGYWESRRNVHGPFSYRFTTPADHLTINFKLFSRDCFRDVMARVSSHIA